MKKRTNILKARWFIIALVILLLNDFLLKGLFGNWITGKLSDFAGLFVFSLFFANLIPKYVKHVFWLTAIAFIYWKSSYSQSVIDSWNSLDILTLKRVIDYTDLIALTVLPVAYLYFRKPKIQTFKVSPVLPFLLSCFAFIATSKAPEVINVGKEYHFNYSRDTFYSRLTRLDGVRGHLQNIGLDKDKEDTIWVSFASQLCSDEFEALVFTRAIDSTKTEISCHTIMYQCDTLKPKKGEAIHSFETMVIDQLKK